MPCPPAEVAAGLPSRPLHDLLERSTVENFGRATVPLASGEVITRQPSHIVSRKVLYQASVRCGDSAPQDIPIEAAGAQHHAVCCTLAQRAGDRPPACTIIIRGSRQYKGTDGSPGRVSGSAEGAGAQRTCSTALKAGSAGGLHQPSQCSFWNVPGSMGSRSESYRVVTRRACFKTALLSRSCPLLLTAPPASQLTTCRGRRSAP